MPHSAGPAEAESDAATAPGADVLHGGQGGEVSTLVGNGLFAAITTRR